MSKSALIAEIIKATAWPITTLIVIWCGTTRLPKLLGEVREHLKLLRFKDFQIEMQEIVRQEVVYTEAKVLLTLIDYDLELLDSKSWDYATIPQRDLRASSIPKNQQIPFGEEDGKKRIESLKEKITSLEAQFSESSLKDKVYVASVLRQLYPIWLGEHTAMYASGAETIKERERVTQSLKRIKEALSSAWKLNT